MNTQDLALGPMPILEFDVGFDRDCDDESPSPSFDDDDDAILSAVVFVRVAVVDVVAAAAAMRDACASFFALFTSNGDPMESAMDDDCVAICAEGSSISAASLGDSLALACCCLVDVCLCVVVMVVWLCLMVVVGSIHHHHCRQRAIVDAWIGIAKKHMRHF